MKSKDSTKVIVHLTTGKDMWGTLFLEEGQRLQDLLNDARVFLPFYGFVAVGSTDKKSIINRMTLINKNSIFSVEEIK